MNANDRLKDAVKSIVNREVDEPFDLWPQIADQIQTKETVSMNTKWKFAWATLLVVLATALVTTIAYALFTYFRNDPGMESVSQAGLVTDLEMTAVPTPAATPTALPPAAQIGAAQTRQGITLTLDWIYLDDGWQSLGFSANTLPQGQRLGQPRMTFGDLLPQQYRGAGLTITQVENGLAGRFLVAQILRDEKTYGITETFADVAVEIPLLDASEKEIDTFRFASSQVPVHQGQFASGNTYAVRATGQEIRLESISITPQETRAQFCSNTPLRLENAALQWARQQDEILLPDQPPSLTGHMGAKRTAKDGWECVEVLFPGDPAPQNLKAFRLVMTTTGAESPTTWEFAWSTLPHSLEIPGIAPISPESAASAQPTPLASQENGDIRVTLLQAYADTLRAAAVLRIEGGQPGAYPELVLTDPQGLQFNTGYGVDVDPADPNLLTASFTFGDSYNGSFADLNSMPEGRFVGNLVVKTDPWGPDSQSFTFKLDLPLYPVTTRLVNQAITSNGIEIRLQKIETTPSYSQAHLCYQLPTPNGDWYIDIQTTTLQIGDGVTTSNSMEWVDPPDNNRCLIVGFLLGSNREDEPFTLTIHGLRQTFPEVIPNDQIQMAREKLRLQGIEMDWITFSGTGGGGAGPQITQKPEGMTDNEVVDRFYDALGYWFSGNWVFNTTPTP